MIFVEGSFVTLENISPPRLTNIRKKEYLVYQQPLHTYIQHLLLPPLHSTPPHYPSRSTPPYSQHAFYTTKCHLSPPPPPPPPILSPIPPVLRWDGRMDQFRSIDTSLLLVFGESPSGEGSAPGPDHIHCTRESGLIYSGFKETWSLVQKGFKQVSFVALRKYAWLLKI